MSQTAPAPAAAVSASAVPAEAPGAGGVPWLAGDYIAWGPLDQACVVRLTGVQRWYLFYECADGVDGMVDSTIFRTWEEKTADWRRATGQEVAAYEARCTPAPQNYL